ncbi:hypothetical protein CBR_g40114 [Chara braunii]|uniref:HAT C-terminal dimerisation domain-containing protein n=1 Tax=Chara braunii TaxID=69332 RepID=A0A388LTD5_CHABU|nr:hypothetical protein CBR_g40114 [Chara braunii]|eukprot:GBG85472.1 hypothetical protein CBR_g40114 [Chara braunii]
MAAASRRRLGNACPAFMPLPDWKQADLQRSHVVWEWIERGQDHDVVGGGNFLMRCRLCHDVFPGSRSRAVEHFTKQNAHCPRRTGEMLWGLQRAGAKLKEPLSQRLAAEHADALEGALAMDDMGRGQGGVLTDEPAREVEEHATEHGRDVNIVDRAEEVPGRGRDADDGRDLLWSLVGMPTGGAGGSHRPRRKLGHASADERRTGKNAAPKLFDGWSTGVHRMFNGCSTGVQRVFNGCSTGVQRVFNGVQRGWTGLDGVGRGWTGFERGGSTTSNAGLAVGETGRGLGRGRLGIRPCLKRLRQQKMTVTYGGEWIGRWRKTLFCWEYSRGIAFNAFRNTPWRDLEEVALQQPGGEPLPVLPSHIEIASMRVVEIHREELAEELEEVRQPLWFEDFHMQQGRSGTWGGGEGLAQARTSCSGDCEMLECVSWWSQYGGDASDLQYCALRLMHMSSCASPAERNWAVHEGIHTKKRNQLTFEKVVHLVEIIANVRLMEYRRAGCGYVLHWQRDEGMLDAQAGLELEPVRSGTRSGMTEEEIEEQAALITRDPIGSSALPLVESIFGARAAIFRPYPKDDASEDERELEAADDSMLPVHARLTSCTRRETVARQLVLDPHASGDLGEVGVHSGAPPMEERERRAEEHGASGAGGVEGIRGMEEEVAGAVGSVVEVDDGAQVEREEAMARVHDGEQVERVEGVLPSEVEREDDVLRTQVEREEGVAGVDDGDAQVEMEEDVMRADVAALVGGEEVVVGGDVAHGRGEGGDHLAPIVQRFVDDEMGPALAGLTPGTRRALGASPLEQTGASGMAQMGMRDFIDISLGDPPSPRHAEREDMARALAAAGYST